jgi:membrane protease YdiL (CAAX protease family)
MQTERPPAQGLSYALIVGLIGFVVFFATIFLLGTEGRKIYWLLSLSDVEARAFNTVAECIVVAGAGFVCNRVLRRHAKVGFWDSIQWRQSYSQAAIFIGFGLGASLLMRCAIAKIITPTISNGVGFNKLFALIFLGTIVLEPFIEEVYFRGILFGALAQSMSSTLAISLVTFLFVFLHPGHQWIVLPIGTLLGITRLFTKSTANCFALHAAYNLGVVLWGIR